MIYEDRRKIYITVQPICVICNVYNGHKTLHYTFIAIFNIDIYFNENFIPSKKEKNKQIQAVRINKLQVS